MAGGVIGYRRNQCRTLLEHHINSGMKGFFRLARAAIVNIPGGKGQGEGLHMPKWTVYFYGRCETTAVLSVTSASYTDSTVCRNRSFGHMCREDMPLISASKYFITEMYIPRAAES
ncbi:hypothetical protein JTB14_029487 [Gonioctena quinquepunctata]|nr:hypothetical protein JTB14_029487 [Gonioctena quinquepunctata]